MSLCNHFLINGEGDTAISPLDRGLAYGDGVFRTLKIRQGIPDTWSLHYQKLREDCSRLGIACPSSELLLDDVSRLFTSEEQAVAKIIVTRGEGPRGYAVGTATTPTRIVIREAYPAYPETNFNEGVSLHLCRLRLAHQPQLAGIKHLNRLENVLARSEWTGSHLADGVLLDEHGLVIECTMSNLFARYGKTLLTAALDKCGVAGVTRQRILDIAPDMGYLPEIAEFDLARLMQADEIIICNSLYGAWQVRSFNHREWPLLNLATDFRTALQV